MITSVDRIRNWVFDPQKWDAYGWEQFNCGHYKVESKVNLEKSVDYIFKCAAIFEISIPQYYLLPQNHERMEGKWGSAEGERIVRLRLDADWTVAIHEMAHIIQCKKYKKFDEENRHEAPKTIYDWSPHGAIYCGILAYLYEELGLWPKGGENSYGKHLTIMEYNGDGDDCDFEYSSREELWNLGILPEKEYEFGAAINNWLHKHNRIKRVNQELGQVVQTLFESSEMPHWKAAKADGACQPIDLFGDEVDDEDFVEYLTNPCHNYSLQQHQFEATPEGCTKFVNRIKKRGIKDFLLECRGRVIDELLGQYEEHLSYNYPHLMGDILGWDDCGVDTSSWLNY